MFIWVLGLVERVQVPFWKSDKGRVSPTKVVADPKGLGHETLRVERSPASVGRELYTLNGDARILARSLAGRVEVRRVLGDVWLANGEELPLRDWTPLDPQDREFVPDVIKDQLMVYREPDERRTYKVQLSKELCNQLVPIPGVPIEIGGSDVMIDKVAYGNDRYLVTVSGSLPTILKETEAELRTDSWYQSVIELGQFEFNGWTVTVEQLPND
ncbi:hypothetical protein IID24_05075 [Patescibacteria group bacterium]|nr:hypothetical protein [Patescibacteria group bacterium]